MKNVVGVIARYMTALQEFRRSVSMKVAFDRVGVDRNTISRTAAIAELSLAAPEVFHALPPWDEKEETLAHYAVRCRQAMDDSIKAKIKAMKAKGELLPIVSKWIPVKHFKNYLFDIVALSGNQSSFLYTCCVLWVTIRYKLKLC